MHSQVMFGGVSKFNDVKKLEDKLPFVLVATPGRLLDHMENTVVGGVKFGDILSGISVLVLDEVSFVFLLLRKAIIVFVLMQKFQLKLSTYSFPPNSIIYTGR